MAKPQQTPEYKMGWRDAAMRVREMADLNAGLQKRQRVFVTLIRAARQLESEIGVDFRDDLDLDAIEQDVI